MSTTTSTLIKSFNKIIDPFFPHEDIKTIKFPDEWKNLIFLIEILKRDGYEINAQNVMLKGKNRDTTALYMKIVNRIDKTANSICQ